MKGYRRYTTAIAMFIAAFATWFGIDIEQESVENAVETIVYLGTAAMALWSKNDPG